MSSRIALLLAGLSAFLLCAPSARAQENGLKIGDGRLHPYFDLEGDYDTAAQVTINSATNQAQGVGDFIIHFRPGLKLDVPSPTFAVTLSGAAEYLLYTGINSTTASQLNRLQAEANLDIGILRGSAVSLDLGDHFTRSDTTTDVGLPIGVLSFYNDARVAVALAPGGGSLTITPGYHLLLETYSPLLQALGSGTAGSPVPGNLDELNYIQHKITLENRWRFLPKTAILLDGEFDARQYSVGQTDTGETNTSINLFKATTGVTGLITPHVATVLRLGWAMDLTASSFSSIIGQLEGTYLPSETAQLRLGFLRNFEPVSAPFVSYEDDRGYMQGRVTLFGRLTLNAALTADYLGFHGATARNDLQFTASAGADFEVTRWFILGAGGDLFSSRSSDANTSTNVAFAGLNLASDEVYLRLTFTY